MTETTTAPPEGGASSSTADAGGTTASTKDVEARLAFLEQEAKKAFAKRDEYAAKVKAMDAERKAAQQAEAERNAQAGQWEEAYNKLLSWRQEVEPKVREAEVLSAFVGEQVEAKLAALPEDLRDVIPDGLNALDRLRLIDKLAAHTTTARKPSDPPAPKSTAPAAGGGAPMPGTPEWSAFVKSRPIDDVEHTKRIAEARKSWWQRRGVSG